MIQEENIARLNEAQIKEMGNRIKDARKAVGITSLELANYIGVGKDQMSRIETGKVVLKTEYLYVLPNLLNVSVEYLLYGTTTNKEKTGIHTILSKLKPSDYRKAINVLNAVFDIDDL